MYFLLVRSSIDPTFYSIFVCGPLQFKCQFITENIISFCCISFWALFYQTVIDMF